VVTKPIMVAEMSINHLGMLNIVKKMIDAAIVGGADFIKLKLKNVNKYYKDDGKKWRNFNFKEYRQSLELSREDFVKIAEYCKERGISWFCTVHDKDSLDFIRQFDPPFYKIASMDANKEELVGHVMDLCEEEDKPMIISIGGKSDAFTSNLIQLIKDRGLRAYVLHTVSIYPTPIGKSNAPYIRELKRKYETDRIKIGYSGHEIGYAPTLAAVMFGAAMIERHFCLSTNLKIHHIRAGLTPKQYREMNSLIDELVEELNAVVAEYHQEELTFLEDRKYE